MRETADAISIVFDVPSDLSEVFAYRAGQFVTFRIVVDGEVYFRSYSMSSSPEVDRDLQVTVKRVPGGIVSNWLNDNVAEGMTVEVNPPAGTFVLGDTDREIVALAAGSGITPVFSLVKTALASTPRRVRLLYANQNLRSAIFATALDELTADHPDRLVVEHHQDIDRGFVDADEVIAFVGDAVAGEVYICGPTPFMAIVDAAVRAIGVVEGRIHLERFTPSTEHVDEPDTTAEVPTDAAQVTIELGGRTVTVPHRAGFTVLESARWAGLRAPSSCESGKCATCMARVVEGSAEMRNNEALSADEVTDGWVLTCQAVPMTPTVKVVYD